LCSRSSRKNAAEAEGEGPMSETATYPVAVIGGGPVGLAAAAHLIARNIPVTIYEAGETAGATIRDWGHVSLFSPWRYNVDNASRALLAPAGWREPDPDEFPTGAEFLDNYVLPLARVPAMANALRTGSRVTAVTRAGVDKVTSKGREDRPFSITFTDKNGETGRAYARAVIDASGTWRQPNPLGADGMPAAGEMASTRIAYGIPDVLGRDRDTYASRSVLVVGAGHSAANALIDLVRLQHSHPQTKVAWATRSSNLLRVYGGGPADQLPARGDLGAALEDLVTSGKIALTTGFPVAKVSNFADHVTLHADADRLPPLGPFERVIVATGQRPDFSFLREIRLDVDAALECARALAPLIDPNLHSCGSVRPHGYRELSHPEPDFYTVGVKSYGRAPTFLLVTGYEQARSVVAAIAGDRAAADDVNLVLPETGVCSGPGIAAGAITQACCGGPAKTDLSACCAADEEAKVAEKDGCRCSSSASQRKEAAHV
jgi:thioredoxin reductase